MSEPLWLADWRRAVARMYERWREESPTDPAAATDRWRQQRDLLFRDHPQSPLAVDQRARFGGLPYFAYDRAYRLSAVLEPDRDSHAATGRLSAITLPASGDEPFSFHRIGHVRLSGPLAGGVLPVFWIEGYAGGLFLPFRDATSGSETYGAGRYLLDTIKGADLGGAPERGELILDFNLAYHPSCAYDPRWNCPLAPTESTLAVAVRVGERLG